jgi:hypothetical protein
VRTKIDYTPYIKPETHAAIADVSERLDHIRRELSLAPSWRRFTSWWGDCQRERHELMGKLERLREECREGSA